MSYKYKLKILNKYFNNDVSNIIIGLNPSKMHYVYQKWKSQVNKPCDKERLHNLLEYYGLLVIEKDILYAETKNKNQGTWFEEKDVTLTPYSNKISIVNSSPELLEEIKAGNCVNVIAWDDKKIKTPFNRLAFLENEFNIKDKDLYWNKTDLIDMFAIPDVQFELPGNYFPRHYFPFKDEGDIRWFINVLDFSYATYDSNDTVDGVLYHSNISDSRYD